MYWGFSPARPELDEGWRVGEVEQKVKFFVP